MDLDLLGRAAIKVVRDVSVFIREEREKFSLDRVESKGEHDFVSYVDKNAEKLLVQGLGKVLPESGFIAEEGTSSKKGEIFNWVIDPLDGTTNFIHGAPPYSISVALLEGDEVIMGIVYEITLQELFYSHKGEKAYLNGKPIQVSQVNEVSKSLIATGFPYNNYDRMRAFMNSLEYFFVSSNGVRRLGSAAADLAYVACGRYDAFYEYNLHAWDVAAGAFLIQQAGGKVSDFTGGNNYIFGGEIVAANSNTFNEFQSKVGEFMNE